MRLLEKALRGNPTPGCKQSAIKFGVLKINRLEILAVRDGVKPVAIVERMKKYSPLVAECGLMRGERNIVYRDTPEGRTAYERTKVLLDEYDVRKGGKPVDDDYHIKLGKLLGYTDKEITEFLNQTDEDCEEIMDFIRKRRW